MPFPLAGEAFSLGSAMFWAIAVVLFKRSGERTPPLTLNFFKNVVALVLLVPTALVLEGNVGARLSPGDWLGLCASGVLGITVADTLFFASLNRLGAGLSAIVDCLYSPAMILFAVLFVGESVELTVLAGGALIVAGILLCRDARPLPGRTRRDVAAGIALGALAMLVMALSMAVIKRDLTRDKVFWVTALRLLAATPLLLPLIAARGEGPALRAMLRPSRAWWGAVTASVLGTYVAMLCWVAGMTFMDMSASAVLNQMSAIFIFLLAATFLNEPVTRRRLAALALAFCGAVVASLGG